MWSAVPPLVAESSHGWHYAAWVSVDLRLLVFVVLIAALASGGVSAILVKSRQWRDYVSVYIIAFAVVFAIALLIFNEIAHYPVFVVEAFFPFP